MAQTEQRLEAHQVQVLLAHLRSVGSGAPVWHPVVK